MTLDFAEDRTVVVTGGTGSFGRAFVAALLRDSGVRCVRVVSRDELKQYALAASHPNDPRLEMKIGNVRDANRLRRVFEGADVVVHAGAQKQIGSAEANPFEAIQTNVLGAQNVVDAALDVGVPTVMAISTDKASSPANVYGATKLLSDKLFIAGNVPGGRTKLAVCRYGNVMGSRGSVVPLFRRLASSGTLPITDLEMTRYWITLSEVVVFVGKAIALMQGGEVFVPKLPSVKVVDLARAIAPDARFEVVGARPGEKVHEEMISVTDARTTLEDDAHFRILRTVSDEDLSTGKRVAAGFAYRSDTNGHWLGVEQIRALLAGV